MRRWMLMLLAGLMGLAGVAHAEPSFEEGDFAFVSMETSKGEIVLALDNRYAPISVKNFLKYVEIGHYEGTVFHRVMPNFMIQGGGFDTDMMQKDTDDPIKNEWLNGLSNRRGTISMARTPAVDSATSQFFINVVNNKDILDMPRGNPGYAVFGMVLEGMDVVDEIKDVETVPSRMNPREVSEPKVFPTINGVEEIEFDDLSEDAVDALEVYIGEAELWREESAPRLAEARRSAELAEKRAAEQAAAFAKAQAALDGAEPAESGLVIADGVVGEGDAPESAESQVTVHYRGWLENGRQFDASYDSQSGNPITFPLNGVIAGWTQGVLTMREGGTRYLKIPSDLAYGEAGRPPVIPGGATLIFEVTMIDAISEDEKRAPFASAEAALGTKGRDIGDGLIIATEVEGDADAGEESVVRAESVVTMHYSLWLEDGIQVFDTRMANAPEGGITRGVNTLQFPGIERGMVGMVPGETRVMRVPPELGVPADRRPPSIPDDMGFIARIEVIAVQNPVPVTEPANPIGPGG